MAARTMALSPEREQQLIDGITALDWHLDPIAQARGRIASLMAVTREETLAVLQDLMRRGLVELRPEQVGSGGPLHSKWVRPDQGAIA
jgi:hypothetical protein